MWEKAEAYNRQVSKKYVQRPKNAKIIEHYANSGYGVDKAKSQTLEERKKNQKFIVQMAEFVNRTERKKYNGYGKPIQNAGYT